MSASAGRPDDDFFCFASSDEDAIDRQIMRENERTVKPVNLLRPAAVPPKAALPRRKITFSFKTKKSARAKSKNVKAIFMLGSALTRGAAGLRFGSRAKFSPSRSLLFARSPKWGVYNAGFTKAPINAKVVNSLGWSQGVQK
jgi:hypothetical protein